MKVKFEKIIPDKNCSFRTIHFNALSKVMNWQYHYHPEVELVCIVSGGGTRHIGYHKSSLKDGDLCLIGSNVPHSGFGLNARDPHEEIVLQFKEEILQFPGSIQELSGIDKMINLAKLGIHFHPNVRKEILPKLFQLLETKPTKRYFVLLEILSILSETEDYTILNKDIMPYTIISRNKDRLQKIFSYVESNYDREIHIETAATLANLTLPAFCNFFKKATQITFTEFVNQYRINKACTMLLEDKNIIDCCYSCGFNNISYFNRIFKKYMNKTPTEFKNELVI